MGESKSIFAKISIVGLGLIGGSMGMALVGKGLANEVWGIDVDPETLRIAEQTKAAHCLTTDLQLGVENADLVILATPVGRTEELMHRIVPFLKPDAVVTDVGSVKGSVVRAAEAMLPPGVHFIGGHPMAGSEIAGIKGADRYLFENAVFVITPTENTSPIALHAAQVLTAAVGARMVAFPPQEHDLLVAAVSHLPHLLAATLVNTVGELQKEHHQALMLAAGGFRDTTRIAAGQSLMWRDIFLANRDASLEMIRLFRQELDRFEVAITQEDASCIEVMLDAARNVRQQVPAKAKGYLPPLHEIIVTVPDRPGMIAEIATHLGQAGININDIEIMRVREGDGGTIRLGLSTGASEDAAVQILLNEGIIAKKKQ